MKTKLLLLALVSVFSLDPAALLRAASSIDGVNRYAWGANAGWMDWRGDGANGAVVGPTYCSGQVYAANFGWVSLGSGAPTNGIQYQNLSADDYGVNVDPLGNLRGYGWGGNIGWIVFEANGAPSVDFGSGILSGYAWGANVGWMSLSNAVAFVQTTPLAPPNDQCAGALALTNGVSYSMDTLTATSSGDPLPDCQSSLGKGVWFSYSPLLPGTVSVSTCGSSFDTVLAVYTGSCGALSPVICQDNDGPACGGLQASVAFPGLPGETYYILAGGFKSASGTLNLLATSPSNDQCAGAVPLADGASFSMSTLATTSAGDPQPVCHAVDVNGVWFTYTAPASGDVLVSTCGSSFNTVLQVYGGGCGALIPVALGCDDGQGPACPGSQRASVRFAATGGATYYLLAGGYKGAQGALTLRASLLPVLQVSHSGGVVTITWPGAGTLQSATNLNAPTAWTTVTSGGFWSEPMTRPAKFFRVLK